MPPFTGTALLLLGLSACAHVTLQDETIDGSLGTDGVAEFHTLTTDQTELSYDEWQAKWNDLSHPMCAMSVDTFLRWKSTIEKLCSYHNECTYDQQVQKQQALDFLGRVESFRDRTRQQVNP